MLATVKINERQALLTVACVPPLAAYGVAAAVIALLLWIAPHGNLDWATTARAAGGLWLAAHRTALVLAGAPLGMLPLLPTVLLVAAVAHTVKVTAVRAGLDGRHKMRWLVAAAAAGHGVAAALLTALILAGDPSVISASPLWATIAAALVAAAAATAGAYRRCGLVPAAQDRLPCWAGPAIAGGLRAAGVLLAAGLAVVLLGLAGSTAQVAELFESWGSAAGVALGLVALLAAYLPNAAIGGASWLAGPGVTVGSVSATPFAVTPGALPPVPLVAALPEEGVGAWWLAAAAAPVLAGVVVGRSAGRAATDPIERLRVAIGGTAVLALACLLLAELAGGRLGTFGAVDVHAGQFALAAIGWALLPAGLVAWWHGGAAQPAAPDTPEGPAEVVTALPTPAPPDDNEQS